MDWITEQIAIGNIEDALDLAALKQAGIRAVLGLTDFPNLAHSGLRWHRHLLIDGAGNPPGALDQAVETLATLVREQPPVLVHCQEGKSRSAAIVALYLARTHGLTLTEACAWIQARRPQMAIDPALFEQLGSAIPSIAEV
jgi:protein-tyrosine phosphatase